MAEDYEEVYFTLKKAIACAKGQFGKILRIFFESFFFLFFAIFDYYHYKIV